MHVPISIFAIACFIMLFTYTATAIYYPEDEGAYTQNLEEVFSFNPIYELMTFEQWINMHYTIAEEAILEDLPYDAVPKFFKDMPDYELMIIHQTNIRAFIKNDYRFETGHNLFEIYKNGFDWWKNSPYLDASFWDFPHSSKRKRIREDWYNEYLKMKGYEEIGTNGTLAKYEKGFIDQAKEFVGMLGNGVGGLLDIISFNNIPHTTGVLKSSLQFIFVWLWLILIIGILPVVSEVIKAIGSVIPFT